METTVQKLNCATRAEPEPEPEPELVSATVVEDRENDWVLARDGWTEMAAGRAVSCLLVPRVGDRVLAAAVENKWYVLHVLERVSGRRKCQIALDEGVVLSADTGRLTVAAKGGISVVTPATANILASHIWLHAGTGESRFGRWKCRGDSFQADVGAVKLNAVSVETTADRLVQRLKNCYRRVSDLDRTWAGQLVYTVKNVLSLRGKHSVVTAEQELKLDGERIHMG